MPQQDPRFEVHVGTETDAPSFERDAGSPFRIAILGDFSGRSNRAAGAHGSLRTMRIDRDEVDATIAAIAPELRLVIDPEMAPVVIRFAELDDFHPDTLAERLPVFQSLLELRREAMSGSAGTPSPRRSAPKNAATSAGALAEGSLLDMILDASPEVAPASTGAARDELSDFVRQAVRPHAVQQAPASQTEIVAKIDAVLEATMRVVLHHPDFQALEALWRATDFFVRRLETSADLQVFVVDAPNVDAALGLRGEWSLIVADYRAGTADVDLVARLADFGRSLGAPVIAGAHPSLAGAESFANDADPDDWDGALPDGWDSLRRSSSAAYVGLALPRLFLRLPYGKATDECSVIAFEEVDANAGAAAHESYLWGNGAIACALIVAEGVEANGQPATQGTIDRLPLHVETVDGEARTIPCTEAALTQRAVTWLLDRGLTPLASMRDADVVRAPRIQSIAFPPRALAIPSARSE